MTTRTRTSDRITVDEHGRTTTTIKMKRACNGCGQHLGDLDQRDVDPHGELTDVRAECQHCASLVELEAAGCTTWQILRRDLYEIDGELDELGVFTKGWTETVNGKLQLVGLRIGERPNHVVARFGDTLVRHPDGTFTVHAAPATEDGR